MHGMDPILDASADVVPANGVLLSWWCACSRGGGIYKDGLRRRTEGLVFLGRRCDGMVLPLEAPFREHRSRRHPLLRAPVQVLMMEGLHTAVLDICCHAAATRVLG
jgi:hypothetical protein